MRITIELRRPARRSVALLLGVLLLSAPAVVLASHQFPDVPTGSTFHDEIEAITEAGITAGFDDGTYRPSNPVTRQAMAAFMHRGLGRISHDGQNHMGSTIDVDADQSGSSDVPAKEITITVPGASNDFSPMQMVYVHARIELSGSFSTSVVGCPCVFGATIHDVTGLTISPTSSATFESSANSLQPHSWVVDSVFVVPPGQRTFRVDVTLFDREITTNAATFLIVANSTITAMAIPFGPDGTNEINP